MVGTVVISFHRAFITKNDKAFIVNCFYMEESVHVSHGISVSMIPTTDLAMAPPMPACDYRVLTGGPLGKPVKYARVGDAVYHKWSCEYPMLDMYCMIIHSCTVDDGDSGIYELIDEDGCAKDDTILQDLTYTADLMAGTPATVFKFADQAHVFFACQVRLGLKHETGGVCPRPSCSTKTNRIRRHKRDIRNNTTSFDQLPGEDLDLTAQTLLVFDLDDEVDETARIFEDESDRSVSEQVLTFLTNHDDPDGVRVCLSQYVFGLFMLALMVAAICTVAMALCSCMRYHRSYDVSPKI